MAILKAAQDQVSRLGAIEEHFFKVALLFSPGRSPINLHNVSQSICWPWLRQVMIRSI